MSIKPAKRPAMALEDARAILQKGGADLTKSFHILGVRHLVNGKSVRRVYDDQIFLVTKDKCVGFSANTDANGFRVGHGSAESTKGMAMLKPGLWKYMLGMHKGQYLALVQAAAVIVLRDADGVEKNIVWEDGLRCYMDKGDFGIHIHHGSNGSTSSLGCQTIVPEQWDDFMKIVTANLKKKESVEYLLIKK